MSHVATLEVNLSALRANYSLLKNKHRKHSVAGVVKANAYGLGIEAVAGALWQEGCKEFFVATLAEGIELRGILPKAHIAVFNGIFAGEENEYWSHKLTPVVNHTEQLQHVKNHPFILHVDTGMTRLGLSESEVKTVKQKPTLIMSHLACASETSNLKNTEQLTRFKSALAHFPGTHGSLSNSSGIFLPPYFHFDLARPGCALYGINPTSGANPMQHVATLSAPILQIRTLEKDETVGYGATYSAKKGTRIATVGIGYADGYFRLLGNKAHAYVAGRKVPLIGRVSMDMVTLDVSGIPESEITRAEFIGKQQTVDDIANAANTIGYEIFTRIGSRVKRIYTNR